MTLASTVLAAWLGSMFLYSAALKFADYPRSAQAVLNYRVLPTSFATGVGLVLPWVELAVAISLLCVPAWRPGAAIAVGLGSVFVLSSVSVLWRKIDISCGCAGSNGGDRVGVVTCLRACAIVAAGSALMIGRASAMPRLALGAVVVLSLAPALISFGRRIIAAQQARAEKASQERDVVQLLNLLASPFPDVADVRAR